NDSALDNIRLLDVTPQLDKRFAPGPLAGGAYGINNPARLTFTVTNRTDLLIKDGWAFTDTLPADLRLAVDPAVASTCAAGSVTAVGGGNTISVANGTLAAGAASCTITVSVTSSAPGVYTNGPSNIRNVRGLDLPANTSVTFLNSTGLRLQKSFGTNRVADTDQVTLSIMGAGAPVTGTTAGTGAAVTSAAIAANPFVPGVAYNLSEIFTDPARSAFYDASYACTNAAGGQAPSGSGASFTVTPTATDDLTCTFTNKPRVADLQVTKTANPTSVRSGELVTFTITASNLGSLAANNAVLRDAPGTGLDCAEAGLAAPTCTANGGASCPAAGTLTAAGLLGGAGVAIPVLPANGSVAVGLQCRVTASGRP
ncbi:MAG: hypothetical protein WKG03_13800, partial [Telluria sp.]